MNLIKSKLTKKRFGYYPYQLSKGSHKKILIGCKSCGKLREVEYKQCKELCWECMIKKRKHKTYNCKICGKKISYPAGRKGQGRCITCSNKSRKGIKKPKLSKLWKTKNPFKGKHHTKEAKEKISLSNGGTGIPYENIGYSGIFYKLRKSIRERDNYICQVCGKTQKQNKKALSVHHIDYDKKNCKEINLISLCRSCHVKTNGNREVWLLYFKDIIKNR